MLNEIILKNRRHGQWLKFSNPVEVISTFDVLEVRPMLAAIESKVKSGGFFAAGFLSYEASPGFDPALKVQRQTDFPLLCFGLFKAPEILKELPLTTDLSLPREQWQLSVSRPDYLTAFNRIKEHIQSGDTYQVNYTLRQQTPFKGDAYELFNGFASDAPYSAFVDMESHAICCASPELFFDLSKQEIQTRPMKGTAPRGLTLEQDNQQRRALLESVKDRAENIMIVDMIRNDLGRIATQGSVKVGQKFRIEKYPTVWQMTSSVSATTTSSVTEIMSALFPCASITGAPKVNTMGIISELESTPRKIYTGSIGFIAPDGDAQFNVAIRTALVDKKNHSVEYGIGGGIVWDSDASSEYEECLLKAKVIRGGIKTGKFQLLETILWTPQDAFFLLDEHLQRLADSAAYFDYAFSPKDARVLLAGFLFKGSCRLRLLLSSDGEITLDPRTLESNQDGLRKIRLATQCVDSGNVFLYHKTTHRRVYDQAMSEAKDCDDVILWNEKGEITESTIANIVIRANDKLITPKVSCGLLNGTMRQNLLKKGEIQEAVISRNDLFQAQEIYLINSVRKWQPVELLGANRSVT